jgi:hypothetical protein
MADLFKAYNAHLFDREENKIDCPWIKTEERLPGRGEEVLIYSEANAKENLSFWAIRIAIYNGYRWTDIGGIEIKPPRFWAEMILPPITYGLK